MPELDIEQLESQLDSFDPAERLSALERLLAAAQSGRIALPPTGTAINLHFHTFFSYNACGYSPTKIAWLARKAGLAVAGIVDFDVLDGLDEFRQAAALLGLKATVGLETRVFIPEFADAQINSPGEPGISYHMGVGFVTTDLNADAAAFLGSLAQTAQHRNRQLTERVNAYLDPVQLDYDRDVLPLTPGGNPTERHLCLAYARKAQQLFADRSALAEFWGRKLAAPADQLELPEAASLQGLIRAKTMKRGGVGYVQPDGGSFCTVQSANEFILSAGGIPTHTWLDGTSAGEQRIEELLDVVTAAGVAAVNIIPDRNYTRSVKDDKLANLRKLVEIAEKRHLVIVVGTEMNSPGQKFVDDFDSAELAPLLPSFLKGAHIVYAHSLLQQHAAMGYTSDWARQNLAEPEARNRFFEKVGRLVNPSGQESLNCIDANHSPQAILDILDK